MIPVLAKRLVFVISSVLSLIAPALGFAEWDLRQQQNMALKFNGSYYEYGNKGLTDAQSIASRFADWVYQHENKKFLKISRLQSSAIEGTVFSEDPTAPERRVAFVELGGLGRGQGQVARLIEFANSATLAMERQSSLSRTLDSDLPENLPLLASERPLPTVIVIVLDSVSNNAKFGILAMKLRQLLNSAPEIRPMQILLMNKQDIALYRAGVDYSVHSSNNFCATDLAAE